MGARYVWGRYTAKTNHRDKEGYREVRGSPKSFRFKMNEATGDEGNYHYISIGLFISISQTTGAITVQNYIRWTYNELANGKGGYIRESGGTLYYAPDWKSATYFWDGAVAESEKAVVVTSEPYTYTETYYTQGSFLAWESAQKRSGKPDGYSGGYYYTYQGQDNIDPQSVSIPDSIRGDSTISIQLNPSTQKKYGGTVSYQYQYKADDGEWVTVGTSAAVSYSIKVPNDITTIQARARAQDDIGFTSSTWVTSQQVTVAQNSPPTAPGSIEVKNAIAGQYATVTITEATDPDGYVAKYIFERQVDGGNWEQVSTTTTLAYFERVGTEWATVAYRACAVDNEETKGPYITSETFTVNVDFVVISGPPADLGDHLNLFGIIVTVSISDQDEVTDESIRVEIAMDEWPAQKLTAQSSEKILINIDTRYLRTGRHTLKIHAEKEDHMAANADYIVNIPPVTKEMLARGEEVVNQDSEGRVQCPVTFARSVYGPDGKDVNTMIQEGLQMVAGNYTGTGASGQGSPNELAFPFAPRLLMLYRQDGTKMVQLSAASEGGSGTTAGITFAMQEDGATWYAADPESQMNAGEVQYGYYAIGNWTQKEGTS